MRGSVIGAVRRELGRLANLEDYANELEADDVATAAAECQATLADALERYETASGRQAVESAQAWRESDTDTPAPATAIRRTTWEREARQRRRELEGWA